MVDGVRPTVLCSFVCGKNILSKKTWPAAFYEKSVSLYSSCSCPIYTVYLCISPQLKILGILL